MIAADIFLLGLIIGSFLNVCILRIPRGKSVVLPSSRCPACKAEIKPYDNIPVLSWLLLGGRCRKCKASISPLYPFVEFLTGVLFLSCYLRFGPTADEFAGNWLNVAEFVKWAIFAALLVVLTITDVRERILPDKVNFLGLGLGLALSLFTAPIDGSAEWLSRRMFDVLPPQAALSFGDALLGAAIGGGFLWAVAEGYFRLRGREGMGLGDVKMMLMAGSFLGPQRTLLTILVGSLFGSMIGVGAVPAMVLFGYKKPIAARATRMGLGSLSQRSKGAPMSMAAKLAGWMGLGPQIRLRFELAGRYQYPMGTYLGAAALLVVFVGSPALAWYRSLLVV